MVFFKWFVDEEMEYCTHRPWGEVFRMTTPFSPCHTSVPTPPGIIVGSVFINRYYLKFSSHEEPKKLGSHHYSIGVIFYGLTKAV